MANFRHGFIKSLTTGRVHYRILFDFLAGCQIRNEMN